ncbi:VWA domain-containing protein [Rhodopirellula sp.]|nr:VWA domain-containing protein [Rhodopirellula sp.]MDA7915353.1 VWA domain-containing protein [bacterium]
MGFLFPIMAVGSLLIGVPIYLHLRRRDEKNLVEFPTLRFLDDQPVARSRPMWPRNWPLMLLRIICILLLIASFSWPYFDNEQTVIVEESRVYILDNTLSVQTRNRFESARDQLADEIESADMTVQTGVIELGSTARVVARLGDKKQAAATAVRDISPGAERGDFVDAFRTAAEMLTNSLGAKRRIILLSDSQTNQWSLDANAPPFLKNIEVDTAHTAATDIVNLAISAPQARRVTRDGEAWIEAGVTVSLQGEHGPHDIVFRDRGREMDRVRLEPASDQIETNTEQQTIVGDAITYGTAFAQWKADPTEWTVGEITLDGDTDDLAGDNRAFFSLPPIRKGKIELIVDSMFLRRALSPEVMSKRWDTNTIKEESQIVRDSDSAPDVLCLESHRLQAPDVRSAVRADLSAGRGVILFVNKITPVISGFLREMGIEAETSQQAPAEPATFRYVYAEHPIFAPFRTTELGNLAEVEFKNYRRLKVKDATSLAFSASGDPLVFEANAGPGRLIVFGFSFDRNDTNWPIHPTFIPFIDQTLQYVRGESKTETFFQPGESVVWNLPAGTQAKKIVVSPLDPSTMGIRKGSDPIIADVDDRTAIFSLPSQPGHFSIRYDLADSTGAILDVNPSPLESELVFESETTVLDNWRRNLNDTENLPTQTKNNQTNRAAAISLSKMEALQQLNWWYILTAAMALLIAETIWGVHQRSEK